MTRTPKAGRPPADYGPIQLAEYTRLPRWLIKRARAKGLVPAPDADGRRWSGAIADDVARRAEEIQTTIGAEHPIGANRAAQRLADRTGLDVDGDDIRQAARHGHLHAADQYQGRPLYDCRDLDELDPAMLEPFIAERLAWLETSYDRYTAAKRLGWSLREFQRAAAERGIEPGRFGRYPLADVDGLAADEELDEEIRGNRLLGADKAAALLDIRRRDFDYCVAAGWITPAEIVESRISKRRTVDVPLYRAADIEALREIPSVDWEVVRAVKPNQPSPLREFARLGAPRGALVRCFAAYLVEQYHIHVACNYDDARDQWELRWNPTSSGEPSRGQVRAALRADHNLAPHSRHITLRPTEEPAP